MGGSPHLSVRKAELSLKGAIISETSLQDKWPKCLKNIAEKPLEIECEGSDKIGTDVILINTSTSYKHVNVESNNLLGYASCWIQQLVAPGVLQVVGSYNLGA